MLDCRPPATSGSSPHTRGAPPRKHSTIATSRIIPAYAGSTRRCRWLSCPGRDHPRIRGEHNQEDPHPRRSRGSSPHTRGAPTSSHWPVTLSRIIPAYAGSTAPLVAGPLAPMGSSPHTRGARGAEGVDRAVGRIIPAYAGSTDSRIRIASSRPGSSPHTRGARRPRPTGARGRRIIPAYAGSTPEPRPSAPPPSDHPRIRGEHDIITATGCRPWGSSPHTRGARADAHGDPALDGIIPAYAGSTPAGLFWRRRDRDHPRIRGEHLPDADGCAALDGSSPHTRGALQLGADQSRHLGIIPAYAGSTSCGRR